MKKKEGKPTKYLIDFLIVAFGVFLGMYANEWQNDKKLSKSKEKTVRNIISELESNKEELVKRINYHELIKVNLDSTLKKIPQKVRHKKYIGNKEFSYLSIEGWSGPGFAEFDNTAFEVAKMNGILQEMDIDLVLEISKVYNKIKTVSDFHKAIFNRMARVSSESTVYDVISNISIITGDNLFMEKKLILDLNTAIKEIKTDRR